MYRTCMSSRARASSNVDNHASSNPSVCLQSRYVIAIIGGGKTTAGGEGDKVVKVLKIAEVE